jgi:hypothetical protein
MGYFSLFNTSGSNNIGIGQSALYSNFTGSNNTAIGYGADVSSGNLVNATAVGSGAVSTASNLMAFGNFKVVGWAFGRSSLSNGVFQVGTDSSNGNGAYLTAGGAWTNTSDRNKKDRIAKISGSDLLNKLMKLDITEWSYIGTKERHIGPMAQDFAELFHVGTDNTTISTIDPAGIALKAIQEQQHIIETQSAKINSLSKEMQEMREQMAELRKLIR